MQKISWSDIFSLDDKTAVTEAISIIQQLQQVYQGMISAVTNSNNQLDSSINDLKTQCDQLSKSVQLVGTNFEGNKSLIIDAASQSQKLVDQYGAMTKAQNDNALSIQTLTTTYNTLGQTQDEIKKKITDQAGSLNDLKLKLAEAEKAYKSLGDASDQATKDAQLQKIKDLNTQYLTLNKSLQDAKKATDQAAGSYNQLQAQVSAAFKELKALEGGMESNGKKFNELKTFIKDGNDRLKEFDKELGFSQREVGNYEKATEGLKGQFEGLLPKLGESGEKIETIGNKALSAWEMMKGLGTSITGLVVASGALIASALENYFTRTSQGALELFEATTRLEFAWIQTKDVLAALGGGIVDVIKSTKEYQLLMGTVSFLEGDRAKQFEANELKGRKLRTDRINLELQESHEELEKNKLIFDSRNKLKFTDEERLEMAQKALDLQKEMSEAAKEQAKAEATQQIRSIVDKSGRGSIANLGADDKEKVLQLLKAIDEAEQKAFTGTRRVQAEVVNITQELYTRKKELAKEDLEAQTGIDNSLLENDVEKNNAILANLKATEKQRIDALKQNAADEIEIAKNTTQLLLIETQNRAKERIRNKVGAENFDAMSPEAQQALLNADKVLNEQRVKINQDYANKVLQINNNLNKALIENETKFFNVRMDNQIKLVTFDTDAKKAIAQSTIEFNQKILNSDDATYEERNDSIQAISDQKIKILSLETDKAIELATIETKKKIQIDGLASQHNQELSVQTFALLEKYQAEVEKVNTETVKAVKENIFTVLNRDLTNLNNKLATQKNFALEDLAKSYQAGNLTVTQYETQRKGIIRNAEIETVKGQLDMYEELLDSGSLSEKQYNDILAKSSAARLAIVDLEVNYTIEKKKALNQALMQLGNEIFSAAKTFSKNQLDVTLANNQAEVDDLTAKKEASLQIVGDDKAAQARINQDFNKKSLALQKEANAAKRKDAIFQKEVDATKIITDTAVGVAHAISMVNIPLAFVLGAMGAVELATVLGTKIPAYGKGTEHAKEGWSLVGEAGAELGYSKGKAFMYDKPTLTYLDEGTKIFNSGETGKILESLGTMEDVRSVFASINFRQSKSQVMAIAQSGKQVVRAVEKSSERIVAAMSNKTQDVWDETGYHRYLRDKNSRIERLDKRYTLGG